MRKKLRKILMVCLAALVIPQLSFAASAHSKSQKGILQECSMSIGDTMPDDGDNNTARYYIGGEEVGWIIDERFHTNGTKSSYYIDPSISAADAALIELAAESWSSVVTFTRVENTRDPAEGFLISYYNPTAPAATFVSTSTDSNGHFVSWTVKFNRKHGISKGTAAHEFGHAIGLNDLTGESNSGSIMYYPKIGSVLQPKPKDLKGARVITGSHVTHTWKYKFQKADVTGSYHTIYCETCGGISASSPGRCSFGANGRCGLCGAIMLTRSPNPAPVLSIPN